MKALRHTATDEEALRIIEALGVDPRTVLAGSLEVRRWPEDAPHARPGKPYLVTYTTVVMDGLDVLDEEQAE